MGRDKLLRRLRRANPFEASEILVAPRKRLPVANIPRKYGEYTYRSICDWIEGALVRYRNRFLTDEAMLILLHEGSNTITFMTSKTLECVDDGIPNCEWDRCLMDPESDLEVIMKEVYYEFVKRHPAWEKTWFYGAHDTDLDTPRPFYLCNPPHDQPEPTVPPPPAVLEVDDRGLCWSFMWDVVSD